MSHVSTVPNNSLPSFASSLAPSTLSSIHFIFVAEKYASIMSPVFCWNVFSSPFAFKASAISDVRRHCHTIALYTGSPVSLFHTIAVSLWFVMPIAAISAAFAFIMLIASTATPSCVDQISFASCSTHPGFGKNCLNSFCAMEQIFPASSNNMHLLLVVPASSAIMYFPMCLSSHFCQSVCTKKWRRDCQPE